VVDVDVAHDGTVWAVDFDNGRVEAFTPAGAYLRTVGAPGLDDGFLSYPRYMALDGAGDVIVPGPGSARVQVFDPLSGSLAYAFGATGTGPGQFTFTRPGSKVDDLLYGDFMDEKVTLRVEVTARSLDPSTTLLSCRAQVVSAAGDPVFEQSHAVHKFNSGPYQNLLNEIKARL